jgi:hypothetical protein
VVVVVVVATDKSSKDKRQRSPPAEFLHQRDVNLHLLSLPTPPLPVTAPPLSLLHDAAVAAKICPLRPSLATTSRYRLEGRSAPQTVN